MTDFPPWNSIAKTRVLAYQRIRHVWDTFTHTETDSWGNTETTSSTLAWTTSGGVAGNFDIASGVGTIAQSTLNAARFVTAGSGLGDVELTGSITVPAVITGDDCHAQLLARFVDTSNHYSALVGFGNGGNLSLLLSKTVGGSFSTLASTGTLTTYAAGTTVKVRFQCYNTNLGASLRGRVWLSTEDEPDEWTLEDVVSNDPTLLLGGVGVRCLLGASVSNSLPVVLSFDDFNAFSAPVWQDITAYVTIAQGDVEAFVGRQTELSDIEPSRLSLVMKNQTGWFTPDNVTSPYWPDWGTGTPLRVVETIGARSFPFPDMWVEIPEVTLSFEGDDETHTDRTVFVSGVDLLTRLNRAPLFVSNLGEHIKNAATANALRAYYPLTDPSGATYANPAGPVRQEPLRFERVDSYSPVGFDETLINFGGVDGPPGDDASAVEFTPVSTAWGRLTNSALTDVSPTDSGVATLVCWVYVPEGELGVDQIAIWREFDTSGIYILVDGFASSGGDEWRTDVQTFTGSATALTLGRAFPGWHLLGVQVDFSDGDVAFWVDTGETTDNTGGSGTNGLPLDRLALDGSEVGASGLRVAHVQCYIGDSDAFTHADFLAQYEFGIHGLGQKQRVDERIRQICNSAGIIDGQLDLEESDSLIQPPTLAGARAGERASAAAVTGGGILFTRGSELVYQDRKHRFGL